MKCGFEIETCSLTSVPTTDLTGLVWGSRGPERCASSALSPVGRAAGSLRSGSEVREASFEVQLGRSRAADGMRRVFDSKREPRCLCGARQTPSHTLTSAAAVKDVPRGHVSVLRRLLCGKRPRRSPGACCVDRALFVPHTLLPDG